MKTATLRILSTGDTRDDLGISLDTDDLYRTAIPIEALTGPVTIGGTTFAVVPEAPLAKVAPKAEREPQRRGGMLSALGIGRFGPPEGADEAEEPAAPAAVAAPRDLPLLAHRAIVATLQDLGPCEPDADRDFAIVHVAADVERAYPKLPAVGLSPRAAWHETAAQIFVRGCGLNDDDAAAFVSRICGIAIVDALALCRKARASGYIAPGVYVERERTRRAEIAAAEAAEAAKRAAAEAARKTAVPVDLNAKGLVVVEVDGSVHDSDFPTRQLGDPRFLRGATPAGEFYRVVFAAAKAFPPSVGVVLAGLLRFGWSSFEIVPGVRVLASDATTSLSPEDLAGDRPASEELAATIARKRAGSFDAGPIDPTTLLDERTARGRKALAGKMRWVREHCKGEQSTAFYAGAKVTPPRLLAELFARESPAVDPEVAIEALLAFAREDAGHQDREIRSQSERLERDADRAAWIAAGPKNKPSWTAEYFAGAFNAALQSGIYTGPKPSAEDDDEDDGPGIVDHALSFVGLAKEPEPSDAFIRGVAEALHGRDAIRGEEVWSHLVATGAAEPCLSQRTPAELRALSNVAEKLGFVKKNAVDPRTGARGKHFVRA